jgi:hypothetical protein
MIFRVRHLLDTLLCRIARIVVSIHVGAYVDLDVGIATPHQTPW